VRVAGRHPDFYARWAREERLPELLQEIDELARKWADPHQSILGNRGRDADLVIQQSNSLRGDYAMWRNLLNLMEVTPRSSS